jgi:uncharacterized membrane protein YbhN (UPF0104 family)
MAATPPRWTEYCEVGGPVERSQPGREGSRSPVSDGGPAPSPVPRWTRRALAQWLLAFVVSGGLLAYLFVTRDVDPRAFGPLIAAISPTGVVAFVAVSFVGLIVRTLRYWMLLEGRARFFPLALVTLVRNLFVDLVPARAGAAVSYLYLVTARLGLPVEAAIASFTLSFVLDSLALAPLLLLAVLFAGAAPLPPALLVGASLVMLIGAGAALVLLGPALRVAATVTAGLPAPIRRAAEPLARAAVAVGDVDRMRVLLPAFGLSLVLRVAKYGAYYCLLQALLVSEGRPLWSLDPLRVFLSIAGAELAASLPLPTIASLGPYEAAGALGFERWLGLPRQLAALAATAFHVLSQVHDYGLGLIALVLIMAPWAGRARADAVPRDVRPGTGLQPAAGKKPR